MKQNTKIKVVGVGGSGTNTVSRMAKCFTRGVDLIAVNTDIQSLRSCRAEKKVLIGERVTKGRGTGMDVSLGERAVRDSKAEIEEFLKGTDMVFITSGLGGGTGSPGAPVIAEIAKSLGILTIAVVTKPFSFEGEQRKRIASLSLQKLKETVDTLLIISNDRLLKLINEKTKVLDAFWICDEILKEAVQGITDLIFAPGIINVDFADIKTVTENSGRALFGVGRAKGENRASEAAFSAVNSPLLDFSIIGAKAVLFNISGSDLTLSEAAKAAEVITKNVNPRAQIIFGAVQDKKLKRGEIKIIVIATGF